jgi:ABC-2 type transport system permease protein
MRNIMAIAGKELRGYFHSPIAYLLLTVWTILVGLIFYLSVGEYINYTFRMEAMGGMGQPMPGLNEVIVRGMLQGFLMVVLLFMMPLITMRLYAEEKRTGTIELLLTSPLTDLEIILGKYLGALALYGILVAITLVYISVLFLYGNPSAKPIVANVLGLLLYGAALLAVGMWISTFTRNQIIAGVVSMVAFLMLYIFNWPAMFLDNKVAQFLSSMAISTHIENFSKGVIQLSDVVYYVSVIILGIFFTARSVEALKGRP